MNTTEEQTTGEIEMETEQITNTVIGDIENQNTVTMTQQAYHAIKAQHIDLVASRDFRIAQLSDALREAHGNTIEGLMAKAIDDAGIEDTFRNFMDNSADDYVEHWAENYLNSYIEDWANNYINDYIDLDYVASEAADNIDGNDILNDALYSMCDSGKNQVAELVNELINNNRIRLPEAVAAPTPTAPAGLDQQAIYTALDQIQGGIGIILAQMDANQPEVTE